MLDQIATFDTGGSFGELALLNNAKRSATIVALQDCDFGVVDKVNFDILMANVMRKKFAKKVDFLSHFQFLNSMGRIKKERLSFFMKKQTYQIGQKLMEEGKQNDYIYFVEKGVFEINKNIYIHQKKNLKFYEYLRFNSSRDKNFLQLLLNSDSQVLYSPSKREHEICKITHKGLKKKVVRVCQTGKHE
jgi:hypothetical protein